jgi:hypothetical protein
VVKGKPRRPRASEAEPPVVISVRIQPRASRNGIVLSDDGGVKVRLTAPPVDGAANEALVSFLAEVLAVSKSRVEIIAGHTSRDKRIRISGITDEAVQRLLYAAGK